MERLFFYLVALGLGAFHALEPGHGKTVVAAYLVGSRGKKIDAVILGLIVTLTHTSSIIILAIIAKVASAKWALSDEVLHAYLGLGAGALILAVGLWMLVGRLRGQEPLHFHSHGHGHSHDHSHDEAADSHSHDHDEGHSNDHSHTQSHESLDEGGHSHGHSHDEAPDSHSHDHGEGHSHEPGSTHSHADGHDAHSGDIEAEGRIGYWPLFLLGVGCVVYVVAELALAAGRCRALARFGAVNDSTGQPIEVTLDRRTRSRRRGESAATLSRR